MRGNGEVGLEGRRGGTGGREEGKAGAAGAMLIPGLL